MKKIVRSYDKTDFDNFFNYMRDLGANFTVTHFNTLSKIQTENGDNWNFGTKADNKAFIYYQILKKAVENSGLIPNQNFEKSINYFRFKPFREYTIYKDVECLDINSAYLSAMLQLHYIEKSDFDRFKSAPKLSRLFACGMLASCKEVEYYKGGSLTEVEIIKDENKRQVFFHAAQYVDKCLTVLTDYLRPYFLFYWVDGIFLKKGYPEQLVKDIFEHYKFEWKIEPVSSFESTCSENYYFVRVDKSGDSKTFHFPNKSIK